MRIRNAVAFLTLVAVPSLVTAQEAVLLRVSGQPGQFNRYQITTEMFMRPGGQMAAMMSSDTTLPMNRMTRYVTRTITSVAGDTLEFTEVLDSGRTESPAMPQMAAMMPPMANDTTVTRMDARGRIFTLDVGTTPVRREPGMGGPGGGGPGSRGGPGGGGGRNMAARFSRTLFALPAQAIRPGESWSDSTTYNTETGGTNFLATYRLDRVETRGGSRIAVIAVNGTQSVSSPAGPTVMSVTGEMQIDVTHNRLAELNLKMAGNMNNPQMGGLVPVRIQISQRLI